MIKPMRCHCVVFYCLNNSYFMLNKLNNIDIKLTHIISHIVHFSHTHNYICIIKLSGNMLEYVYMSNVCLYTLL